jgi:hypothetical protein
MEPLEIRNRNLDTLEKPHITIINQLPDNPQFLSTRIDISDQTKINQYNKQSYISDDSTITIYSNRGVKFSPRTYKTLPEYERLGMNNAGDTALINIYVHTAINYPLMQLLIGKGSKVQFGDTITFTAKPNGTIILNHKNKKLKTIKTEQSAALIEPAAQRCVTIIGLPKLAELINLGQFLKENPYIAGLLDDHHSSNEK